MSWEKTKKKSLDKLLELKHLKPPHPTLPQPTAMAMAIEDSVTVSIGDEIKGVFSVIFLVSAEVRSCNQDHRKQFKKLARLLLKMP